MFDNIESSRFVYKILRDRLNDKATDVFSDKTISALKDIYESYQTTACETDLNPLPENSALLEDF